jgi:membrane-bound ClpP family serine protease
MYFLRSFIIPLFLFFSVILIAEETPTRSDILLIKPRVLDSLIEYVKYDPKGPNVVGHLYIGDHSSAINEATWLYVKNGLEELKKSKPVFVILELNTPGGEVFAAQKIADALKDFDTQLGIPIICYIDNWAISAGAMLAYSCRYIAIAKDASMGAAEPVIESSEGKMETASEKINSALRADFSNRAAFFGRNPLIAEAMVDKDIILVLRDNKITKLDNENQIKSDDVIISPKGKLLTLDAKQLMEYGVADIFVEPHRLDPLTSTEKAAGEWPAQKNPLFTLPFFKDIPQATIKDYIMDWKTRFFAFLAHPMVSSLLLLGLIIGLYLEMSTPGVTLPGLVAGFCLFFIILSSFALEAAGSLEFIFLGLGLVILFVDMFLLPSFGVLGFFGLCFFLGGLFGLMVPGLHSFSFDYSTNSFNAAGQAVIYRLGILSLTLLVAIGIIALLSRYVVPRFYPINRFVLSGDEQVGFIAGDDPVKLPGPGTRGKAVSTLRPSGKIEVEGTIYDAVSDGEFIEKDAPIYVERLDGSVIIVNELKS